MQLHKECQTCVHIKPIFTRPNGDTDFRCDAVKCFWVYKKTPCPHKLNPNKEIITIDI